MLDNCIYFSQRDIKNVDFKSVNQVEIIILTTLITKIKKKNTNNPQ